MTQSQSAKISQSLRNENDLKPTPHDLENIFDTDEEIEAGDSVIIIIVIIITFIEERGYGFRLVSLFVCPLVH